MQEVGYAISDVPQNIDVNSKIVRQLGAKRRMIESGKGVDWSTAEALALGTLLCESIPVRLSGEDSQRGTFSQRHAVLIDQMTEERYIPLSTIRYGQAPFEVIEVHCRNSGCWVSSTDIRWQPHPLSCGKRSSATSQTARR